LDSSSNGVITGKALLAAMSYADAGQKVIPLAWYGQRWGPLKGSHGHHDATDDDEDITEMFSSPRAKGVGIRPDGMVVLDLDEKNGRSATRALTKLPKLPPTLGARTKSGGRQLWYRRRQTGKLNKKLDFLGEGIEVKDERGYLPVWPSVGYRWTDPFTISTLAGLFELVTLAPTWLDESLASTRETQEVEQRVWSGPGHGSDWALRKLERFCEDIRDAPPGHAHELIRNLSYTAGGFVGAGELSFDHALTELSEAGRQRWDGDVPQTVRSGLERGAENPIPSRSRELTPPTGKGSQFTTYGEDAPLPDFQCRDDPGTVLRIEDRHYVVPAHCRRWDCSDCAPVIKKLYFSHLLRRAVMFGRPIHRVESDDWRRLYQLLGRADYVATHVDGHHVVLTTAELGIEVPFGERPAAIARLLLALPYTSSGRTKRVTFSRSWSPPKSSTKGSGKATWFPQLRYSRGQDWDTAVKLGGRPSRLRDQADQGFSISWPSDLARFDFEDALRGYDVVDYQEDESHGAG
jgi:hypothetical protein